MAIKRVQSIDQDNLRPDRLGDQGQLMAKVLMVQTPHGVRIAAPEIFDAQGSGSHSVHLENGDRHEAINTVDEHLGKQNLHSLALDALFHLDRSLPGEIDKLCPGLPADLRHSMPLKCILGGKRMITAIRFSYNHMASAGQKQLDENAYDLWSGGDTLFVKRISEVRLDEDGRSPRDTLLPANELEALLDIKPQVLNR